MITETEMFNLIDVLTNLYMYWNIILYCIIIYIFFYVSAKIKFKKKEKCEAEHSQKGLKEHSLR